jgi:hypothetical protein
LEDLPALQAQALANAAGIAAEYDWDAVTDQTEAVYTSVLAKRADRSGR